MNDWQERVAKEKSDLDIKIHSLYVYLEKGQPDYIGNDEWRRMCAQYEVMRMYSNLLGERIANFM